MVATVTEAATFLVPDWILADTEESVLGTQWHQEAIDALANMILEAARRRGEAWDVGRGISLLDTGGRYEDGRAYDPKPDAMVLARPLPSRGVAGVRLGEVGVPLFIAEMASRSTFGNDMGVKRELYEFIGVPEYIVFDPVGDVVSPALHAWRLEGDAYAPWLPDDQGWWHSRSLDIALRPTQPFMTVRDRDGRLVSPPRLAWAREDQLEQELADTRRRLADLEARMRQIERDHDAGAGLQEE